jgi:hypothetical protein
MTCFVVGIAGGVIFANISSSVIKTPVYQKSWHLIPLFGEAVPAAGAGGILEVFFINWSAPGKVPTSNSSSVLENYSKNIGWRGWNNTDNFRQRVNLSKFYVCVRIRANATQAYRTTKWQDTDVRVRWTCAGLGIGADTVMSRYITKNATTDSFIWINFYHNNTNTGFNLAKTNTWPDNPITITSIKFEAFY